MSPLHAAAHRVIDSGLQIKDDAGCVSVPRGAWEALRTALDDETRAARLPLITPWRGGCGHIDCVNGCDGSPDFCAAALAQPDPLTETSGRVDGDAPREFAQAPEVSSGPTANADIPKRLRELRRFLSGRREMSLDGWRERAEVAEKALQQAAVWFEEYAELHKAKGALDKASRNLERANYLRRASHGLDGQP